MSSPVPPGVVPWKVGVRLPSYCVVCVVPCLPILGGRLLTGRCAVEVVMCDSNLSLEEMIAERLAIADLAMSEFLASEAFLAERAAWNAWHDPERVLANAEARWSKPESKEPDVFQCSMGG